MKYIFELNNNYKNIDIILNENNEIKYDNSIFIEYNILHIKMNNLNKNHLNLYDKTRLINKSMSEKLYKNSKNNNINFSKIIYNKFNINEYSYFLCNEKNILKNYYILDENKKINSNKCLSLSCENKLYKNLFLAKNIYFYNNCSSPSEKELYSHKNIIIFLYNLFDILEENGNILITIYNYTSYKTYLIILLVLSFFKKFIILFGNKIYFIGFKKDLSKKNIIKNIFENNLNFNLKNNNIIEYFKKIYDYTVFFYNLKLKRIIYTISYDEYNLLNFTKDYNLRTLLEIGLYNKLTKEELNIFLCNLLIKDNKIFENGNYINNIIIKNKFKACLEIGSSNGLIPINILNKINNINITSLYEKTNNNLSKDIFKQYNLKKEINIIHDNIIKQLKKFVKNKKYYGIIIINLSNNLLDDLYNIVIYASYLLRKNNIIILNNSINIDENILTNFLKIIKKLKLFKKIKSVDSIISYKKI